MPDDRATPPTGTATTDVILVALDGLRDEVRQTREESAKRGRETAERLERLEKTTTQHAHALGRLTNEVAAHGKQIADICEAQVSTARAASAAAEIAARSLARVDSAHDDARKMVESAMQIQRGAIAAEVAEAVEPIRENDARQDRVNRALCEVMGVDYAAIADERKGHSLPPKANLATLAKGNRKALGASTLTLAIIVAEIILRAMGGGVGKGIPFSRE